MNDILFVFVLLSELRGSADAIKLAQMLLHSLSKDPGQDVQVLIQKSVGSSLSGSTLTPSVSSTSVTSSNKQRHVTSSQGTPLSVPQDIFDSMAPPAKGSNAAVASVNAAISPVVTLSDMASVKAAMKKPSSGTSAVSTVSGSIAATKASVERSAMSNAKPPSGPSLPIPGKHSGTVGPSDHVPTSKAGLIPFPSSGTSTTVAGSVLSTHMVSSGYNGSSSGSGASTVLTSSSKPVVATIPTAVGSGVARRLFTHQQPGNVSTSTGTVSPVSSNATASLLGPQPANYPSHSATSPHIAVHQSTLTKSASSHSSKSVPHSGVGPVGVSKQQKSHASSVTMSKEKLPPSQPPPPPSKPSATKMHYSNVISSGTAATGPEAQSAPPPPVMGSMASVPADVIEQPMLQIMNTPMLFQDQITRTKKKSTYSDAVGKKNDASSNNQSGKMPSLLMHSGHAVGPLPTMQQSQQQQPKLNLAPGSRPMASAAPGDKVMECIPNAFLIQKF